jgi:polynucleotide 5'-kinase involved in rRNA processing
VALHFVGATSPARDVPGVVAGARRMLDRAGAAGFDRVLVDTSGLVAGDLGRALKHAKIDALDPDLVIALAIRGECEAIVQRYAGRARPAVLRLPGLAEPRRRSARARRRHRQQALRRYLAPARRQVLDLGRVALRHRAGLAGPPSPPGRAGPGPTPDLEGRLAGLEDARGETLGIAVVRAMDLRARTLEVDTPVAIEAVMAVIVGRQRLDDGAPGPPAPLVH